MLENVPARQSSKGTYSTVYHIDLVVMVEMEKSEESIMHSKSTEPWTVPNKHRRLCSQKRLWRWLVCCCAFSLASLLHWLSDFIDVTRTAHSFKFRQEGYRKREEAAALHQQQQQYSSQPTQQDKDQTELFFLLLFYSISISFISLSSPVQSSCLLLRRRQWRRRLLRSLFFTMSCWSLCASWFLPFACC